MACWVLISHGTYLRPVSNMKLRKRCLVPPVRGASNHWCILLNASEFNLQSKTGTSDDSVVWDVRDLAFMDRVFPCWHAATRRTRCGTSPTPSCAAW